jgi:transcriptional regulator
MQAVVGLEIAMTAIEGKWKMSQNRDLADRAGVIRGMSDPVDSHHAPAVAGLVKRCLQE